MFGRFLELAIATQDILASVQFYAQLGFEQRVTSDAWPHRYGVVGDGRIHLGLHECRLPSLAPSFALPGLERAQGRLHAAGFEPELVQLGPDALHHVRLRDPGGHAVVLQEARTFSPTDPGAQSLCGYFVHLSLPQPDFSRAQEFWERGGFIAWPQQDQPFAHVPLTSDRLDLAFHQPRSFDAPLLLFECADLAATIARLRECNVPLSDQRPRGVTAARSVVIEAPEGTALLLVQASE